MQLISLQPNVNWLSGSISKAPLKMENNWVEPLFVCMHYLHTYARTHHKPTRLYSHWVGGVNCVIVWSWAPLGLIPEWMVCCVPAIPLCLSEVFLGIRPHLLPGAAGWDQSWLSPLGFGAIACGKARLYSGRLTERHWRTWHRSPEVRQWHRSHTPGGGQTCSNPAKR